MEFKGAVTRNLRTSEGLFKFSGRASRAEMLWFWLFSMIWTYGSLFLGAIAIAGLIAVFGELGVAVGVAAVLAWYVSLFVVAVQSLALFVRRMHDVNRSGWWYLLVFTVVGSFVLLYWMLQPGHKGVNQYGKKAA